MKEKYFNILTILKIQRFSWYFALGYFAVVSVMYFANSAQVVVFSRLGVIYLLAMTILKLFVLAEQFRSVRLYRFWLLSYALVLILISTVFLRYLL